MENKEVNMARTMLFEIMVSDLNGGSSPPILASELKQFMEKKCQWDCLVDVYLGIASGNLMLQMDLMDEWSTDMASDVFGWIDEFVEHVQFKEAFVPQAYIFRVRHVYMGTEEYRETTDIMTNES